MHMDPDLKGFPLNQDMARLVEVNWTQPHRGGNPNLSFHHLRAPQVNRDVHLTITIPLYLILQITRFERCEFSDLFVNNCLAKGDSTFTSSPSFTTGPPGVLGTPPFPRKRDFISLPFIIPAHQAVPGLGTSETGGALRRLFELSIRWFKPAISASMLVSVDFSCHRFLSDLYTGQVAKPNGASVQQPGQKSVQQQPGQNNYTSNELRLNLVQR